jgi:hypothetical protein
MGRCATRLGGGRQLICKARSPRLTLNNPLTESGVERESGRTGMPAGWWARLSAAGLVLLKRCWRSWNQPQRAELMPVKVPTGRVR